MTPFDILRQQVKDRPEAIAVSTSYRVATYRKMWSRIERSTARLQGEWMLKPGDTIVYYGCGHLDALVMYLAAARCGIRVLPLEHLALQNEADRWIALSGATLVLYDDLLPLDPSMFTVASRPLSTLIATACRYRESVFEDSAVVSLFEFIDGDLRPRSLDALATSALSCPAGHQTVTGALFDGAVFAPVVLASMMAGRPLTFANAMA